MRRKSYRKSVRKQRKRGSRKRGGSSQKKDKIDLKKYVVLKQKDVNLLYDITKKTIDILDKHGVEYWATDGTLLGIMRSKGFIPWDDDVDIAIDIKDKQKLRTLKDVFDNAGLELVGVGQYMKVKTSNKDVWIDIFILKNGKWPQQHYSDICFLNKNELYPIQKKKGTFGKLKMNIPNKSEQYLNRIFKDWKDVAYIYNHHTKGKKKISFKEHPELKKPTLSK